MRCRDSVRSSLELSPLETPDTCCGGLHLQARGPLSYDKGDKGEAQFNDAEAPRWAASTGTGKHRADCPMRALQSGSWRAPPRFRGPRWVVDWAKFVIATHLGGTHSVSFLIPTHSFATCFPLKTVVGYACLFHCRARSAPPIVPAPLPLELEVPAHTPSFPSNAHPSFRPFTLFPLLLPPPSPGGIMSSTLELRARNPRIPSRGRQPPATYLTSPSLSICPVHRPLRIGRCFVKEVSGKKKKGDHFGRVPSYHSPSPLAPCSFDKEDEELFFFRLTRAVPRFRFLAPAPPLPLILPHRTCRATSEHPILP